MNILMQLHDPALVAKFQKLCGVEVLSEGSEPLHLRKKYIGSSNGSLHSATHLHHEPVGVTTRSLSHRRGHTRVSSATSISSASSLSESEQGELTDATCEASCDEGELTMKYRVNNKFLYYLFHMGAGIGNELFYCIFYPFWFWNMDGYVARRMVLVWAIVMYLGQALKDVVRWPRPRSPPAVKLERRYELEYGMPSTHACVGFSVPFTLLYVSIPRYEFAHTLAVIFGVLWCLLVCVSRIYLGMHSVLDVLVGLSFSILVCSLLFPLLDTIDAFQLTTLYGCWLIVAIGLLACIFYPNIDKWSTARGDTTLVVGVAMGVTLGCRLNYEQGNLVKYEVSPPYPVIYPDLEWFGPVIFRFAIGIIILIATRFVMKMCMYKILCWLLSYDTRERVKNVRQLAVELPYKFITYGAVAFNVVYTAPLVFRLIGVERETYFTEL